MRRFNGEEDDPGKQLKRWKAWAQAKMITMKDLSPKQQGPWLLTLLEGKAWDAVEHLELNDLHQERGAEMLWRLLSERFPEKEPHDQMGEALGEVFALAASDSETMQFWTSRVQEVFQKCFRKAQVKFPSEAQGWIMLHCAGLNEEQKAIVKAKTQGNLESEKIAAALRSCFPAYRASSSKARRPVSTLVVEEDGNCIGNPDPDEDFLDVETFLADHQQHSAMEDETIPEADAAEALAVSWKDRRSEINKLQQSRKFGAVKDVRRSFRIEVEELKKRTQCRKCGRTGHWARECRSTTNASSSSKPSFRSSASNRELPPSAAADVHLAETGSGGPVAEEEEDVILRSSAWMRRPREAWCHLRVTA